MIERLVPHIRQFVESAGIGVVGLDRRGRVVEANNAGRGILRRGDGLYDPGGVPERPGCRATTAVSRRRWQTQCRPSVARPPADR